MNKLKVFGTAGTIAVGTVLLTAVTTFAAGPQLSGKFANFLNSHPSGTVAQIIANNKDKTPIIAKQGSIASALGMTPDQVQKELQSGKTIDQLAHEHGMTKAQLLEKALKNAGYSDVQIQNALKAIQNGSAKINLKTINK
jgi:Holliday junction resolvasome RuvABC DNA-binding subunit